MIVFTAALRTARRSRRIPTLGSLVRVLGSVQIFDEPPAWSSGPSRSATTQSLTP